MVRGFKKMKKLRAKIGEKKSQMIDRAKFTGEQLKKVDKGYNAYIDVIKHKRNLEAELKQIKGSNSASEATLNDKIRLLNEFLSLAKRQKVEEMKLKAREYDEKYPDDLND